MQFIDHVRIEVQAGKGGDGCVAFRREKFVPKGGPSGGKGGNGGSIEVHVDPNLHTLQDLRYHRIYKGGRGRHGEGSLKNGRDGESVQLKVPPGTIIRDSEAGEILADLQSPDDRIVVARGGRGGRGNASYVSPTHQAPREWEPGGPGEFRILELELKVMADVGLVGLPNAGKSTLLSVVSRARPKIADYPFTTLTPNLGIVKSGEFSSFVMADIPGLIEGAAEGKGLGHQFLRHVERCQVLLFLIDANEEDPAAVYEVLRREIERHDASLLQRERLIGLSKIDSVAGLPALTLSEPVPVFPFSSVSREGLDRLLKEVGDRIRQDIYGH